MRSERKEQEDMDLLFQLDVDTKAVREQIARRYETNETINRMIEESGEMWASMRDRTVSPVLVKVDHRPTAFAYELTLPKGEGHPFWRVSERELTPEESSLFEAFRRERVYALGDLINHNEGSYFRVRAYVFNGRKEGAWDISVDCVDVEIVNQSSLRSRS